MGLKIAMWGQPLVAMTSPMNELIPAWAEGPSFDCARAESAAEEAVCADPGLAELDVELARVYGLAAGDPALGEDGLNTLKAMQRGWIKGRDECWKASTSVEDCTAFAYATRITEIRQGYAAARADDGNGISTGPFPYVCEGLDVPVSAGFLTGQRPMVTLGWGDDRVALDGVPAASGAKYEGDTYAGPVMFWTQGDEAMFTLPGGAELTCTEDDIG